VPVEVVTTRRAQQQAAALDRTHARAFAAFLDDLSLNGCAALAYRLTGPVPLSRLCVKHLRAALRVVVAFESPQRGLRADTVMNCCEGFESTARSSSTTPASAST